MSIEVLTDREELKNFLTRDRVGNAYLLGDLDPAYLPYCTWFGLRVDGELAALVLLYHGLRLPVVLLASSAAPAEEAPAHRSERLRVLLRGLESRIPQRLWVHAWEEHGPVAEEFFKETAFKRMIRMGLERGSYERPVCKREVEGRVRRLEHKDTAMIVGLYQHFPDNFFEPYLLETGLYFGIEREDRRELAGIAGIHVHSRTYDIAAIGNLVVHPDCRRQGLATALTSRLLDELFKTVSLVTLNVEEGNMSAIGTYKKFGFVPHRVYFEGNVETK